MSKTKWLIGSRAIDLLVVRRKIIFFRRARAYFRRRDFSGSKAGLFFKSLFPQLSKISTNEERVLTQENFVTFDANENLGSLCVTRDSHICFYF
jgi:hypothetical protein